MKKASATLIIICIILFNCGCSKSDNGPPKTLWYLGGAPILADFSISGGPEDGVGMQTDIVIYVPLNLVTDGFTASILGVTQNGDEVNLLKDVSLVPGEYYVVSKETYQSYDKLSLHLTYGWEGQMMSMRVIDLFSHEDLVPAYPSE